LARKAGIEGRVILQLLVDETGSVIEARVVTAEPPGIFEHAALEAIHSWRYEAATRDGKPIKVRVGQAVDFSLKQKPPPPPPAGQKPPLPPPPPPPGS
jgi:protein TonB